MANRKDCHMLKAFVATVCVAAAYCSNAIDGVWTNATTSAAQAWNVADNWTDTAGNPLGDWPKASGDTATFTPPSEYRLQKVYTGRGTQYVLDSVVGGPQHTINHGDNYSLSYVSQNYYYYTSDVKLTLTNPSGFTGYWANNIGRHVFSLPATAGTTPTMHAISFAGRPGVEVPTAGTTAVLGSVYEPGAMVKTGNGELRIETLDTENNSIYVNAGSLVFRGDNDSEAESILAGAAVRFDASQTNTLTTQSGAGGLTEVTRWNDANGGTLYAYLAAYPGGGNFLTYTRYPFMSAACSPTGLPLVDFGSRLQEDVAELGPTNCNLRVSKRLTNVREVFCAVDYPRSMNYCVAVGDSETYHLCPEGNFVHFGGGDKQYFRTTQGDLVLNGRKIANGSADPGYVNPSTVSGMTVFSVASLTNINVCLLGSGCYATKHNGGLRIGEAIVFTNVLTRAERMKINRYLMRKWQGWTADRVAANVFLASANTTIGVSDGGVAHVGEIVAVGGTVTKTGGGTLVVDRVSPASAKIVVRGGSVRFNSSSVPEKRVADAPYIWLDANNIAADGKRNFTGNPTNYLYSWKDCRADVSTAATGIYTEAPRMPYVVENAAGPGKSAVSFGLQAWGNHSHMRFPNWSGGGARAGFAVIRPLATNVGLTPFGSSMLAMIRESGRIANRNCVQPNQATARWAINGMPADPYAAQTELSQTNDFFLLSFTSDRPNNIGGIAGQRTTDLTGSYSNECGGWEVAEIIVYGKELSEEERRETEAYLMDKWLGKDHPAASHQVVDVEYANGAGQVLDADMDVAVGKVTGDSGVFVKRGTGSAAVASLDGVDGVSVEEGSLSVALPVKQLDEFSPYVHFDAADVSSMNTRVEGSVTNVTLWRSSVGSLVANSEATSYGNTACGGIVDPTLKTVETRAGVTRPTMSFGDYGTTKSPAADAAAMRFSSGASSLLEIHEIVADNSTKDTKQGLFDNFNATVFLRGAYRRLFDTVYGTAKPSVLEGYIAVDGEPKAPDYALPTGFHLVSIAPTGIVSTTGFANDRFASMGGLNISEYIAFRRKLDADERDYVQKFLMAKWLGTSAPAWPTAYDSLSAASGATLSFSGAVTAASVAGGGTISAQSIGGIAAISVRYVDGSNWEMLTLEGTVAFVNTVAVTVVADDSAAVLAGEYPIVTVADAATITIPDLRLNLVNFPVGRKSMSLAVVGNQIVFRVRSPGMVIIME